MTILFSSATSCLAVPKEVMPEETIIRSVYWRRGVRYRGVMPNTPL